MPLDPLPAVAAWRHVEARDGFETVFIRPEGAGYLVQGHTAAVEEGEPWAVRYEITVDERWRTRWARVVGQSVRGEHEVVLEADGEGHWTVDGSPAPHVDGCLDIDLESSALTNTLPVHRFEGLAGGGLAGGDGWNDAPAAYVRAEDLRVERLEQGYRRAADGTETAGPRYDYRAPVFDFEAQLVFDRSGLVLHYPNLATRTL